MAQPHHDDRLDSPTDRESGETARLTLWCEGISPISANLLTARPCNADYVSVCRGQATSGCPIRRRKVDLAMFARVSRLRGKADRTDESVSYLREQILPQARQLPGFSGVLSLVDRSSGASMTVTFWKTEEDMRATEAAADDLRGEAASATDEEIVGVERYEVIVDERN